MDSLSTIQAFPSTSYPCASHTAGPTQLPKALLCASDNFYDETCKTPTQLQPSLLDLHL
jgi:hypothetical protein